MTTARRLLFVLAALAVAAAAGHAARDAAPPPERRVVPDTAAIKPPLQVDGLAVTLLSRGVEVRLEPLDERRRATFFELRTPLGRDPLPSRSLAGAGFVVFELSLRNGSGQPVTFAPDLMTCHSSRDHELRRLQADQLMAILRLVYSESENPEQFASDNLSAFHVEPTLLAHGESASRLLVFVAPPQRCGKLRAELEIQVGGEQLPVEVPLLVQD